MIKIVEYLVSPISLVCDINASDIKEYPKVYSTLLESIAVKKNISVIVSNSVILNWLKKMSSRYPQSTFTFETIDARSALAQQWGIDIPKRVTNKDLHRDKLHKINRIDRIYPYERGQNVLFPICG